MIRTLNNKQPLAVALMLCLGAAVAHAQDVTQPPAHAKVRFVTQGVGTQTYACTAKSGDFVWVFQEPQADLVDAKNFAPRRHARQGAHLDMERWQRHHRQGSAATAFA